MDIYRLAARLIWREEFVLLISLSSNLDSGFLVFSRLSLLNLVVLASLLGCANAPKVEDKEGEKFTVYQTEIASGAKSGKISYRISTQIIFFETENKFSKEHREYFISNTSKGKGRVDRFPAKEKILCQNSQAGLAVTILAQSATMPFYPGDIDQLCQRYSETLLTSVEPWLSLPRPFEFEIMFFAGQGYYPPFKKLKTEPSQIRKIKIGYPAHLLEKDYLVPKTLSIFSHEYFHLYRLDKGDDRVEKEIVGELLGNCVLVSSGRIDKITTMPTPDTPEIDRPGQPASLAEKFAVIKTVVQDFENRSSTEQGNIALVAYYWIPWVITTELLKQYEDEEEGRRAMFDMCRVIFNDPSRVWDYAPQ